MFKTLAKYLGAGLATAAAVMLSGGIAFADPPRADIGRESPRPAVRANREAARNARIDRRAYRASGDLGLRLGRLADRGLAIANLATGGAFYNAGLRPGDYIVSVNGHRIVAPGDFDRFLYAAGPDQPVQIVVWRNGAEQTITVQPTLLYTDTYDYDNYLNYFGIVLNPQYPNELIVQRVLPDSIAFRAGLRAGDVVTNWNGQVIRTPKDFARVIENEKPGRVAFDFRRRAKDDEGRFHVPTPPGGTHGTAGTAEHDGKSAGSGSRTDSDGPAAGQSARADAEGNSADEPSRADSDGTTADKP